MQRNVAILFCACLVALGVSLTFRDDGGEANLAWSVGSDERVRVAAGDVAVTAKGDRLTGRDAQSGEERWSAKVPGVARIQLVADVVLVTGKDGGVSALDAGAGTVRWSVDPVAGRAAPVASRAAVAFTQCPAADRCVVESRALDTGRITWTAPVARATLLLGSAVPAAALRRGDFPVWPSNFAIVPNPQGAGFNVRALDSGAIRLTDRRAAGEALVLAGDVLVRTSTDAENRTTVSGTDLASGEEWRETLDGAPLRADTGLERIAVVDGSLVLVPAPTSSPRVSLREGQRLRTMDPASGGLTGTANELPDFVVDVIADPLSSGPARTPVLATATGDDGVQFGGNVEELDDDPSPVVSTATQVGWRAGDQVTVADRQSGRTILERDADDVRAIGDRIVVREDDQDRVVAQRK